MNDIGPDVYAPAPDTYAPRGSKGETSWPTRQPARVPLARMPPIDSSIVPDTVQLIVDVAGLCSSAPAFDVTRPAGIAPRRSAQRNRSYQYCCFSAGASAPARG